MTRVFFCEPTDRERQWLRRFTTSNDHKCSATGHYCNAMVELGEADVIYTHDGYIKATRVERAPPKTDPRWPMKCDACGRPFGPDDAYQLHGEQIYAYEATGRRFTLQDAPVGAVWDAWWIHERKTEAQRGCGYGVGPDGRSLVVKCPGGFDWHIDMRSSNCTLPNNDTHFCWVRRGRPEDGTLHVDKNGDTCAAGAGSIQTPNWHGFLHNGELA